jgi:uncharacterized protein YjbI with pentapeptide repeats
MIQNLSGADLKNCDLTDRNFTNTDLIGADLQAQIWKMLNYVC